MQSKHADTKHELDVV